MVLSTNSTHGIYKALDVPSLFAIEKSFNTLTAGVKQKTFVFCTDLIEDAQEELAAGAQLWWKVKGMEGKRRLREMLASNLLEGEKC